MIETKHITEMVKHVVRRNRGVSDPQIMHPMREWLTGILVTIVVAVLGSGAAAYLYHSYDVLHGTDITAAATSTPYKVKIVTKALAEYREKRQSYNLLLDKKSNALVASSTEVDVPKEVVVPTATSTPTAPPTVEFPEIQTSEPEDSGSSTEPSTPGLAI